MKKYHISKYTVYYILYSNANSNLFSKLQEIFLLYSGMKTSHHPPFDRFHNPFFSQLVFLFFFSTHVFSVTAEDWEMRAALKASACLSWRSSRWGLRYVLGHFFAASAYIDCVIFTCWYKLVSCDTSWQTTPKCKRFTFTLNAGNTPLKKSQ